MRSSAGTAPSGPGSSKSHSRWSGGSRWSPNQGQVREAGRVPASRIHPPTTRTGTQSIEGEVIKKFEARSTVRSSESTTTRKTKEGQLTSDEHEEQQRDAERHREQQSAPEQGKEWSAFTLIRPQMSASFCTDSSRPASGGGFAAASAGERATRPLSSLQTVALGSC